MESKALNSFYQESNSSRVLQEINQELKNLKLEGKATQIEFHGFQCPNNNCSNEHKINLLNSLNEMQLDKENGINVDNKQKHGVQNNLNKPIETRSDPVILRLMRLFKSIHELINAKVASQQLNSVPSDYLNDVVSKCTFPSSTNVRHHLQVVCTKLERFFEHQRRILDSNRHFDYFKFIECEEQLNRACSYFHSLKDCIEIEIYQRGLRFMSKKSQKNADNIEFYLEMLRDHLKSAHLKVHVFNWEMDMEHRYSASMTARTIAINNLAVSFATEQKQSDQMTGLTIEEQYIAEHYNLGDIVECAKENEEFLNSLIYQPENFFSPDIIALTNTADNVDSCPTISIDETCPIKVPVFGDIIQMNMGPSSPPTGGRRSHRLRINHA